MAKETLDPRQLDFIQRYMNPASKTYNNIYQSALDCGYSESYAKSLRNQVTWVSEAIGTVTKDKLLEKAKKVLDKSLDGDDIKLAQDTAKFVAKSTTEFAEKQDPESTKPQEILVRFISGKQDN
jgi:phage terminase small subunit